MVSFTRARPRNRLIEGSVSALALSAILAGCQPEPQVVSYTVAKPPPPVRPKGLAARPAARSPADDAGAGEASGPTRILGAIVPRGRQTWFFKLTGPSDAVAAQAEAFVRFLKSVEFEGATPRWSLPEGWTQKGGDQFRYATLVVGTGDRPLEMSVSKLPGSEDDFQQYLLANVNRWRDQVQLGPLAAGELEQRTLKLPLADGEAWLVNIEGRGTGGMGQGALPARRTETKPDGQ